MSNSQHTSFPYKKWMCSITKSDSIGNQPFEWHISKGTTIIHDPTSWSSVDSAINSAKEVIDHFTQYPHEKSLRFHRLQNKKQAK